MMPQDSAHEIKFFNAFTLDKDYDSLTDYGYRSIIKAFDKLLPKDLVSIPIAMDLGCGSGAFTRRYLQRRATTVLGVDIALGALRRARCHNDDVLYLNATLEHLPIKTASVDLLIFSGVLHHFKDPAVCLQEAWRVLKQGGYLLSYDPHINNPCMWLYRDPRSPFYSAIGKTPNEILLSKNVVGKQLCQAGFVDIKLKGISGVTLSYLESPRARTLLPFYNAFETTLGLSPLADPFGSFLISCCRK